MPLIEQSTYRAPFFFKNRYINTIYPALFRIVSGINYKRERLELDDGDFLDLDWSKKNSRTLVILLHGLEGDSTRAYVKGMVKAINIEKWDALAMNFRSCSGEANRIARTYHSGETEDLSTLIKKVLEANNYDQIHLIGFSLGGNIILKYAGEEASLIHPKIGKIVAMSPPCELADCSKEISKPGNILFLRRFLRSLKEKVRAKRAITEGLIDFHKVMKAKNFFDFDEYYTAPVHGFASAEDYWYRSSSNRVLQNIQIPTLILSALDDTFISETCYPFELASKHEHLFLETPKNGGHCGFASIGSQGKYWSETRTIDFLRNGR